MQPISTCRRTLLLASVGLLIAPSARAQKMRYRVAWLSLGTKEGGAEFLNGFLEGLADLAWIEEHRENWAPFEFTSPQHYGNQFSPFEPMTR